MRGWVAAVERGHHIDPHLLVDWGQTEYGSSHEGLAGTAKRAASKKKRGEVAGTPFGSDKSPREFQNAVVPRVVCWCL